MKHSSDKRSRYFTAIVCAHLASITAPRLKTLDRELFAKLSHTMLSKAITDATSADQLGKIATLHGADLNGNRRTPDRSSRALQTTEDVALAVAVFRSQGRTEEALKLLEEDRISNFVSTVSIQSWSLMLEKMELLESVGNWPELHELCKGLLTGAQAARGLLPGFDPQTTDGSRADDWKVWRAFAVSASRCADSRTVAEAIGFLKTRRDMNQLASQLATAEILTLSMGEGDDETSLIKEITFLFTSLSAKQSCYQHVIRYVNRLSALGKFAVIRETSSAVRTTSLEGTIEVSISSDQKTRSSLIFCCLF